MAKEDAKIDIEDIKEPEEDLDLEEAVSEEDEKPASSEPVPSKVEVAEKIDKEDAKEEPEEDIDEEKKPEKIASTDSDSSPQGGDEKDVLEKAVEEKESVLYEPVDEVLNKKRKFNWKTFAIVVVTLLVVAAIALGVAYYFLKVKKTETKTEPPVVTTKVEEPKEEPKLEATGTGNFTYINSETGLNMREEPNTSAKVIAIIPFGTKIPILEQQSEWYKTEYSGKQGWVNKTYTQVKNPLVYENTEYGFSLTFPQAWAGYKIFKKDFGDSIALYVAIPTTDKNWTVSEPVPAGYASLFAIGVYTKEKWEIAKNEEGPKPAYLGEIKGYVITWSSGQATPTDLTDRFSEIKTIIATYATL